MKATKIVVLGGNGFVGQRVVNCALRKQASVVGISRSGAPPKYVIPEKINGGITLKWHKAEVFDVASWRKELEGADAVVSCIGAFGSNEFMEKMNGDANIIAVSEALNAGVQRFVYISTVENNLPDFVLKGYVSCHLLVVWLLWRFIYLTVFSSYPSLPSAYLIKILSRQETCGTSSDRCLPRAGLCAATGVHVRHA